MPASAAAGGGGTLLTIRGSLLVLSLMLRRGGGRGGNALASPSAGWAAVWYCCPPVAVRHWAHVDALLTWILIYSYGVNWRTPYSGRLGSADVLCNFRAHTRVHAHWLLDGFAGSLVC